MSRPSAPVRPVTPYRAPRRPPRSKDKKVIRRALADRDGLVCRYCRRTFADPQQATLDHVVPQRLFLTWQQRHLVLCCRSCNQAKGGRFPILIALLLADYGRPVDTETVWTVELLRLLAVHLSTPEPTR